jgi:RNA polymerase sigma factor (sigma-70 family)
MAEQLPAELAPLLRSSSAAELERAWSAFLESNSRLLLRVAHSLGGDHDTVMDRYAYVLEWLRRDEFARLRSYVPDPKCRFSTWLVVVARRLCLDHTRRHYGEGSSRGSEAGTAQRAARRRLVDLLGDQIDPADLSGPPTDSPDQEVRLIELRRGLEEALEALAPRDRLLLKLRFEYDLPAREIADRMRFPSVFHVYRRVNRLLSRLRQGLVGRGIVDPVP